jgi:hypothetical protein
MRQPPAPLHARGIERRELAVHAERRPRRGGGRPCQAPPWRIHPRKKQQQHPSLLEMQDLLHGVRLAANQVSSSLSAASS